MNFSSLTIKQAHQGLADRQFSAIELMRHFLDVIQKIDKNIHAFLEVTEDLALTQAKIVDEKINKGEEIGVLEGIPCAIKDNILVKDIKCTAGSKILENYIAPYDATAIKRLKGAGAVILGKTNLDEFAMGSSTENSAFGPTKNPRELGRVPGGSSGGSIAAVAAGQCLYSLGSETGGSVRQPAAFCGIVGLKPTYGSVSRHGLIAMASSLDIIGPAAKTVEDVELVFNAIKGKDKLDATSIDYSISNFPPPFWRLPKGRGRQFPISNLKVGIPKEYFIDGMERGVEKCVREAINRLNSGGIETREVSLPHTKYALPVYYILMPAEVSANLARYDGIKYGQSRIKNYESRSKNLLDTYLETRKEYLGDEVRRRIMLGSYVLSEGHYDDYYKKARKVRWLIKQDFREVFSKVDLIITPTTPTTAFKFGEKLKDPLQMYLSDILTVSANIAGIPAISVPCGLAGGLPVGIQIMGPWMGESKIFELGRFVEHITHNT